MKAFKFLSIAAVAALFGSCSQNEIDEKTQPFSNAIKFENLSNVLSKGANDANSDYGIYAMQSGTIFSGMQNLQVDGSTNAYSPPRYWPTDGSALSFFGYAPHGSANVDLTGMNNTGSGSNDGAYKVGYTVPAAADEDFTLGVGTGTNSFTGGNVQIDFTHMLSRVELGSVALVQELLDAGWAVDYTGATLSLFVNKNKGVNAISTRAAWTSVEGPAEQIEYSDLKGYYIMPQPATTTDTLRIQLKGVAISDGTGNIKTVSLLAKWIANTTTSGFDAFQYGHKYTVNFTIGGDAQIPDPTDPDNPDGTDPDGGGKDLFPSAITFTSSTVSWIDANLNFD